MLKLTNKTRVACVLCAVALCFGIALAGCSSGSPSSAASGSSSAESSASSAAASSESASTDAAADITVPEEASSVAEATKGTIEGNDTSAAAEFDSLPASDDADAAVAMAAEVEEGLDDASKAPGDATLLMVGGIQMQVPKDTLVSSTSDGYVFQSPDQAVTGCIMSYQKQSGEKVDVEALVKSLPSSLARSGFANATIANYNTLYSNKGTLVGAEVLISAYYNGAECSIYVVILESANYLNSVEFVGLADDFHANASTIQAIVRTISYNPGEAI